MSGPVDLKRRDALAAERFPVAWAKVAGAAGKQAQRRRHSLRRKAEVAARVEELRAAGASCATCSGRGKHPDFGIVCDTHSDFHGYLRTTMDSLCSDWSEA